MHWQAQFFAVCSLGEGLFGFKGVGIASRPFAVYSFTLSTRPVAMPTIPCISLGMMILVA